MRKPARDDNDTNSPSGTLVTAVSSRHFRRKTAVWRKTHCR